MRIKWFSLAFAVIILDQCSKWFADDLLGAPDVVSLLPFLALRKAYNPGAAFSFLSDASGWQRWFFVGLALLVIGMLVAWLRRLPRGENRLAFALALILGGAAGNLIDRVLYGHVIDFIDLYYRDWHWPTFNIADSAITIGAALLLLDAFLGRRAAAPDRQ
jgi:signal peptidase II